MDFFGGLSKLGHAITTGWDNLTGGGDNNDELLKKKQRQQQAQKAAAPAQDNNPAPVIDAPPANSGLNLYQGPELQKADKPQWDQVTSTPAPNALVKAAQAPPVRQPIVAPKVDIPLEATKEALKGSGAAVAGGIMGVGKSVVGLGQGIVDTPQMINSLGNWASNKLTGQSGGNDMTAPLQKATEIADTPFKALNNKFDESSRFIGPEGTRGELIGDIAGTVATIVPSAAELAGVGLAKLGRTGKATELLQKFGEQAHSPIINDAINGVKGAFNPPKPTNNLAPGVTSANPNQATDVAAHAAEQAAKDAEAARAADEAARVAQEANRTRVQKLQAASDGSPLDTPTYQRNTLNLPAGADRNTMAVPINEGTPEGNLLLNQGKPQLEPTGVELRPAVAPIEPTGRNMDIGNINNPIKEGVIPGTPGVPETMVTTPGRNVTDIYSPRGSASPEMLNQAREQAIAKALGQDGTIMNAPLAKASNSLPSLVARADHPQGTDAELIDTLNQIILHPEASQELKNAAIAQREGLLRPPAEPVAPPTPIQTPELAAAETKPLATSPLAEPTAEPQTSPLPRQPEQANPLEAKTSPGPQENLVVASDNSSLPSNVARTPNDVNPASLTKSAKALPKTPQSELPNVAVGDAAKTGDIGQSQGKYAKGQEYEKTSIEATRARGASEAANTSYENLIKSIDEKGAISGADRDAAVNIMERYPRGSAERRALGDLINTVHTDAAQTMATIERVIRRTASSDSLTSRFERKLYASTDDAIKIGEGDFEGVIAKNKAFTAARDEHNAALEAFNTNPSEANMKAYAKSFDDLDSADKAAKYEEYKVAAKVGKGSSNPKTAEFIKKLGGDAGVYTMDMVDTSLLSSTRVMLNNFINTLTGRGEEAIFGKVGAKLARQITGVDIGGGSRAGAKLGAELGTKNWKSSIELRKGAQGNGLTKAMKNIVTSGNTAGDRNTYAGAYSGIYDHYTQVLKKAGYSGDELKNRALVNSLADPDNVVDSYMNQALVDNAMASLTSGPAQAKLETTVTNWLSRKMGDSGLAQFTAKAFTRVTLGFPTVIGRNLEQGGRRALGPTLLNPSAWQAVVNAKKGGPPEETARLIKNAVKQAGSGATMYAVGGALGAAGVISGSYPTDKNERAQWTREGKTEHSINILGNWYSLPASLGVFALPFMLAANVGDNASKGKALTDGMVQSAVSTVVDSMPIESLDTTLGFFKDLRDGQDVSKFMVQTGASLTKIATPMGSLVNELAKIFDPTANDTTQGDALAQFLHKVQDGFPGLANFLPDKVVEGNVIKNPDPLARILGSNSAVQDSGVKANEQIKADLQGTAKSLSDYGALSDSIRSIVGKDVLSAFDAAKNGKPVSETDMKKLTGEITKGVSSDQNTRFLEDGNYDANLAVLKAKRDLLTADPTTTKVTITKYDDQIKRGEVYKTNKTTSAMIDLYKNTSLSEWRNMGDPESDTYDPKAYQALWDHDTSMSKAGVSRSTLSPSDHFYSAKNLGKGGSGSSSAKSNTLGSTPTFNDISFGKLAPQKVSSPPMPVISSIKPGDLIKQRTISHSKA